MGKRCKLFLCINRENASSQVQLFSHLLVLKLTVENRNGTEKSTGSQELEENSASSSNDAAMSERNEYFALNKIIESTKVGSKRKIVII